MQKLLIQHSPPLQGTVKIGGAKNSVLPILAATILIRDTCTIHDVPHLSDVSMMRQLLEVFGVKSKVSSSDVIADSSAIVPASAPYEISSKMRASILVMGSLLARVGKAVVPLPGGCAIGSRPVDLHLKGFAALGAKIKSEHGYVSATAKKLYGAKIYLDFPSVGATENIMMAAVLAKGQTVIENCSVEPEIVDLANFLNAAGGDIKGAGTGTIRINGVQELHDVEHSIIPDRVEAGTFMIAAALTRGDILIENVLVDHVRPLIAKLHEMKIEIDTYDNGVRVRYPDELQIKGVDLKTMPHPGFPTDLQAQFMTLLTVAKGTSIVTETIFENRFMHVGELKRMGADIKIEGRSAVVDGIAKLTGAQVKATDLRAGAALTLAGLVAEGETEIEDVYHILRGYDGLDQKLASLGANIQLVGTE